MIYILTHEFTKIEEKKGVLQNRSDKVEVEFVTCKENPEKDSGVILSPMEKYDFAVEKGENIYARSNKMNGEHATLAVVNFKKPASDGFGAGVGSITYSHALLDGYVKANGDLLKRDDYPELFQFANENKLLLSETDWANNMQGMYAEGDGITTFRVPDLRSEFLRGLDDGRGVDVNRTLGSRQNGSYVRWAIGIIGQDAQVAHTFDGEEGFSRTETQAQKNPSGFTTGTFNNYRIRPRNIALIAQIKY